MRALLYTWNILVILAVIAAWRYGFVEATQANDQTGITWIIAGVFALSQVFAWWPAPKPIFAGGTEETGKDWKISVHPNRSGVLYDASTIMVMLGLFGTVIGFMAALEDINAGDTSGISTALWTTMVGLAGSMSNFVTHRLMGGKKG